MIVKRMLAAMAAVCLGLLLASCSTVSDEVADHWPHFAGGEPNGLPPRPGEPGYRRFIAHGQPVQNGGSAAAEQTGASTRQPVAPGAQPAAAKGGGVGGLY